MNIGKRKIVFLVLCVLFITPVIGCSAFQSLDERLGSSDSSNKVIISEFVTVELGNVLMFDESKAVVGISAIANPGRSAEIGKRYNITILWNGQQVGHGVAEFRSLRTVTFDSRGELDPREIRQALINLDGDLAKQYIDLLYETPEYKRLRGEFEKLQEEKRKFREREEELAYNLFWKGEAPTYDEYKKAMAQIKDMDAREKQIIQEFYEFPFSGVFPSPFVNSLELVVEAK